MHDETGGTSGDAGGDSSDDHGGGEDNHYGHGVGDCPESFTPEAELGNGAGSREGLGSFVYVAWRDGDYVVELSSWADFEGPNTPGEYPITETDADADDCGLCLYFYNRVHTLVLTPTPGLGKIVIDAIPEELGSPGIGKPFAGRHEGLVLRQLHAASDPILHGCSFELPPASWNLILKEYEEHDDDDGDVPVGVSTKRIGARTAGGASLSP